MTKERIRNVPPPPGGGKGANAYTRFIPREELSSFAAWNPGSLGGEAEAAAAAATAEPQKSPEELQAEALRAARQGGYHDGYRDGIAALESFKQSFASQATAQVGALMQSYGDQMDLLQQAMASALADAATALARQVVRGELAANPQQVAMVAREALETLLLSARHVTVRVHPDDQPLVAQGWLELLPGDDARSRKVGATPAGVALRTQAQAAWKQAQLALNERLGTARVAALHELLDMCMAALDPVGETDDTAA